MVPYFCVVGRASSFWPLNLLYNSNLLGKGIQVYLKKVNTNSIAFYDTPQVRTLYIDQENRVTKTSLAGGKDGERPMDVEMLLFSRAYQGYG